MKHFITLTFLMMCLSSKIVYSNEVETICHYPMTTKDIATFIIESCVTTMEMTLEDIQEKVTVSEEINGPGYKKINFNYEEEYIGSQVLVDYQNEEEVCYTESNSNYFCPEAFSY